MKEWGDGLSAMSGEDIKRGLNDWSDGWPPSLPEFVDCCKGIQKGSMWQHRSSAYRVIGNHSVDVEPYVRPDTETVKTEREKLKSMGFLKGNRNGQI